MAEKYLIVCYTVRESVNVMHEFLAFADQLNMIDKIRHSENVVILKNGSTYRFVGEADYFGKRWFLGFRGKVIDGRRLEQDLDRYMNEYGEFRELTIDDVFSTIDPPQLNQVHDILRNIINGPDTANPDAFSYNLNFLKNHVQELVVRELIARTLMSVSCDRKEIDIL